MDAVIVVNKPKGISSFRVVDRIKKLTKIKKVGHAGTLDPSATGVLIICLDKACKKASSFMNKDKVYEAEMVFGITTDSGDSDGDILSNKEVSVKREQVEEALGSFTGEIEQIPPMVSALHHKGQRLYDLARQGITVDRPARKITINSIELMSFEDGANPKAWIRVSCSKGTYIRTLCEDIGAKLGTGAYESQLIRTRSGDFRIEDSHTLEEIGALYNNGELEKILIKG
jgi:tRNA pseudouridine55 synthase